MAVRNLVWGARDEVRLWLQASTNSDPPSVQTLLNLIHWKLSNQHTLKQHATLTLSVPLTQLFFFALVSVCLWLHTTSRWDCLRSFSTLQVLWQMEKKMSSKALHQSHFISCLVQAITYHDRTVCMLPQVLVMVSSDGWWSPACSDYKYLYSTELHNNGFGLLLVHTDRKDDTAATGNAKCIKLHLCNWKQSRVNIFIYISSYYMHIESVKGFKY